MKRIHSLFKISRSIFRVSVISLAIIALAGCEDVSPAIGKYYTGRILHLNVFAMERVPELLYSREHNEQDTTHYRLAPSEPELELVMLRIKVENHKATSAIVSIDERAAELRDFFQGKYFPIDAGERVEEVELPPGERVEEVAPPDAGERVEEVAPPDAGERVEEVAPPVGSESLRASRCPPENPSDLCFLWNANSGEGAGQAFDLKKGFGIEGWMIFEVPKDQKIREIRWRAGDSLSIQF